MFHHLKTHLVQYEECAKLRTPLTPHKDTKPPGTNQRTVAASFTTATPSDKTSRRWREITAAVGIHIAQDMMPINVVEKPGFRNF